MSLALDIGDLLVTLALLALLPLHQPVLLNRHLPAVLLRDLAAHFLRHFGALELLSLPALFLWYLCTGLDVLAVLLRNVLA